LRCICFFSCCSALLIAQQNFIFQLSRLWGSGQMQFVGVTAYPIFWGLMAALAESVGGFLLLIGFCFRPACLFLVINMVVATTMHFHTTPGDFMEKWSVASHAIELGSVFLSLLLIGPGRYSVDRE
ncbi:MAG: DoxX family protein, partial [Chthoniobacterales bacterium]|nr:DoxX family protein [Chthoniobacterales bacterium]